MSPFPEEIFKDGHLFIIDSNGTSVFHEVKLQANPRKQQKYFTSKISQYTVVPCASVLSTDSARVVIVITIPLLTDENRIY